MARLIRTLMFFSLIFAARPAFAGGACPSGANYTNPTNPNGALVTLVNLGITNCYYIAASGSDSNSGTSESSPWLHSPGMGNCSNNCAAVNLTTSTGGIGIIFRSGDTWHFGNSSASPYTGTVAACSNNGTLPGNLCLAGIKSTGSGSPIYVGVDTTWFTGGSWVRPIFTADNPLCNSGTANGTTCVSTTDFFGQPSFYVSSCPYQTNSINEIVVMAVSKYVILDNIELTGLCYNHTGQPGGGDDYINYASAAGPLTFMNLYIHGFTHVKYAFPVASPNCNSTNVCSTATTTRGSVTGTAVGETFVLNVVDFGDSDPGGLGLMDSAYNTAYNVFRYVTSFVPNPLHVFHDNLYEYFFENGHSNLTESLEVGTANAIYNNVYRHIEASLTSGGGVGLWFGPQAGVTDYIFNNVMYDVGCLEYLNNGGNGITHDPGSYTYFNNTFQSNCSQPIMRVNGSPQGPLADINNHYIDDGAVYLTPSGQSSSISGCTNCTSTTPLAVTNAKAKAYGYTSGSTYGYQPTSANCNGNPGSSTCTIGNGTNKQSFCSALSTAAGSDPILSDAAAACANDTLYACSYNTSTHSVSCPARTIAPRPTSTAWNIGAYESNGTQANAPNPPANLAATVQ